VTQAKDTTDGQVQEQEARDGGHFHGLPAGHRLHAPLLLHGGHRAADGPEASEIYKIEKKHLIRYINIGPPQDKRYGTEPVIQLNDQFADVAQIREWVENERLTLAEAEQTKMWVSMKVDQDTKMGVVTDVKQELRKASALKVLYSANSRERTN